MKNDKRSKIRDSEWYAVRNFMLDGTANDGGAMQGIIILL